MKSLVFFSSVFKSLVFFGAPGPASEQKVPHIEFVSYSPTKLLKVKPCGGEACGHDCEYGDWTDWSGCTESCGGGQKYRHRDITFKPNKKDMGGIPCAPKQDV